MKIAVETYIRLSRQLIEAEGKDDPNYLDILEELDNLWYREMNTADRDYARTVLNPEIRKYYDEFHRNIG